MRTKKQNIPFFLITIALIIFSSCSTKKKTWVHRQYHNTTAKYNGYYNGKESIKKGVKKIHENHKDDYTTTLPLYKIGDLKKIKKTHSYMDKAIQKGSVVIQRHSIKIKGREYCKWIDENYLLVGKGYFYKGEYEEAIKTFNFIKSEYKKTQTYYSSYLWLIRSYVQKQDFSSARIVLKELEKEKKFPKELEKEKTTVIADFYLKQKNPVKALTYLVDLDNSIKRKRKKSRYNYITAQIYQQQGDYKKAQHYYEKAIKGSTDYTMTFNAKMNLARSLDSKGKDTQKMRGKLLKMTRDDKNKEYLDQIYYTLAEMDMNEEDTITATNNYLLSVKNSIENNSQKALSFLSLAEIEYTKKDYIKSKSYYDSTIYYMDPEFRLYIKTKETHTVLEQLVFHLETINLEDSLQNLGKLPKQKQIEVINKLIKEEQEQERVKQSEKRAREQAMYESNRNSMRGEQFGNNTSGGKWYFYNPATLSFGMSEFRRKWGKRKLEDDWRRQDKAITSFDLDTLSADSSKTEKNRDKNSVNYYLEKLPKTPEDFISSDNKIKEAYYQAALIFREEIKSYKLSTEMFQKIVLRYLEDLEYSSLAYYNIYTNHIKQQENKKAKNVKQIILDNYPNSIYSKIIKEPTVKNNQQKTQEDQYQNIYNYYKNKNYEKVLDLTKNTKDDVFKKQTLFLRALSFIATQDTVKATELLKEISSKNPTSNIEKEADYIVKSIIDPKNIIKANQQAITGSNYIFKNQTPHMVIIIISKKGADINYLKTLISDYHLKDYSNEVFEISAMLMGMENHLLMIKTFISASETKNYTNLISSNHEIMKELDKSSYRIMAIDMENFKYFYTNKDAKGYYDFYQNNYTN